MFKVDARVLVLDIRNQEMCAGTVLEVRFVERHKDFNVIFMDRKTFQYRVQFDLYYEKKYALAWVDELRILSGGKII